MGFRLASDEGVSSVQPVVQIVIPGRPVPKGRPRFSRRSGRAVTPKRTREYERFCALCGRMAMAEAGFIAPLEGGIGLRVTALFARPAQIGKAHKLWGRPGRVPLSGGGSYPDISNVIKAIEDGLQGVVFVDDHQVCLLEGARLYASDEDEPGVYVEVWRVH